MTYVRKTLRGITWSAFERFSVQGLQLVIFVLMARVLSPVDYGLVGMLSVFIVVSQLLAENGLPQAIIRKLDRNSTDYSTAFYANVATALVIYVVLFTTAPLIARFYGEPRLADLMRVLAVSVIIQSTLVVHRAILTAELDFRTQAKSTLAGAFASGVVALWMTYSGYGVWALVALQIVNQIVTAIVLWCVSHWRPTLEFSGAAFRRLFDLGSKLLVSNVLESVYNCFCSLIIGKVFSAYALGCYSNARLIVSFSSENLSNIVTRAIFPSFCRLQNSPEMLCMAVKDYMRISFLVIAPLMLGLAAVAEPIVHVMIGWQWLYASYLLRILCVGLMFYPLININLMVLKILGFGKRYLLLQILSIVVGLGCLVAMIPFGLQAVCCGLASASAINFVLTAAFGGSVIGFGLFHQIRALLPIFLNALGMAVAAFAMQYFMPGNLMYMLLIILVCGFLYVGMTFLFMPGLCDQIMKFAGRKKRRREPALINTTEA